MFDATLRCCLAKAIDTQMLRSAVFSLGGKGGGGGTMKTAENFLEFPISKALSNYIELDF